MGLDIKLPENSVELENGAPFTESLSRRVEYRGTELQMELHAK